jgi:hypothetical protein
MTVFNALLPLLSILLGAWLAQTIYQLTVKAGSAAVRLQSPPLDQLASLSFGIR